MLKPRPSLMINNPVLESAYRAVRPTLRTNGTVTVNSTSFKLCSSLRRYCQEATIKMASNHPANFSSLINSHIQILGTGANELAPSFYLFTDSKRYLFNCGENLQRLRTEFRLPLTKLHSVFVTSVSWRNLGGLPGMVMSLRDQGVTSLSIYGSELVEEFAEATRYFVGRKKIKLVTPWCTDSEGKPQKTEMDNLYKDENLQIKTVQLYSSKRSSPLKSDSSDSSSDEGETSSPKPKRRKLVPSSSNSTAAFVCKLCDVPGKFDAQRARELGVPPSPLFKKLRNGESVVSSNGTVVHPHEVLGTPNVGPVMIVIECPDESYVSSVVSSPALQSQFFSITNQPVPLIVHMSPKNIFKNKSFCKWMASFGPDTKHLILNEDMCSWEYALRRSMKIQVPLCLLNPSVHHPLVVGESSNCSVTDTLDNFDLIPKESVIYGQTLLKFHLKPTLKIGVDDSSVLKSLSDEYDKCLKYIQSNKLIVNAILKSRRATPHSSLDRKEVFVAPSSPLVPKLDDSDDALVTFLGTGSAAPTSYRNVTGILIQTPADGNVLLDCGEGSLSQIYKCFGRQAGDQIVKDITGVFISHIHGDHHLGVISVLMRIKELKGSESSPKTSPIIIGPRIYGNWLKKYRKNCHNVGFRFMNCECLLESDKMSDLAKKVFGGSLKEIQFGTVPVIHCASAFGVVLKHSSGWKIVYSGDTRPCQDLVEAGRYATLLIHEATFEDSMLQDAKEKLHCTIGETLKISDQMKSSYMLMTHFSSRYPRIPSVLMDDRIHNKVGIAFDCMSIRLKELHTLHSYLPPMKDIFSQVVGNEDVTVDKAMKNILEEAWDTEEVVVCNS